jgi:hypothetical protein
MASTINHHTYDEKNLAHKPGADVPSNSSVSDEKFIGDERVEDVERSHTGPKDIDEGFDPAVVKKLIRRCDWRVVPILSAMYYVSLVDRTNLSLARQANNEQMNIDLNLGGTSNHYSIATLIFFVPYIVFEIPVSQSKNTSAV